MSQTRKTVGDDEPSGGANVLRDALARGAVIPVDRLTEALDDAVRRGRIQRRDAEELATRLVTSVSSRTEEALVGVQGLVGKGTDGVASAARLVRAIGGSAEPPIPGYETLTAAQVVQHLVALTPAQLRIVRDHEAQHANRVSVLRAIDKRLP